MRKDDSELPLYLQAKDYLLNQIRRMKPGKNQLEPEKLLTAKLGMCRETVRKAMNTLIQEGIITRKQGKGNFGHPEVANLAMRIDLNSNFRRILRSQGYSVRSFRSEASVSRPSAGMLKRMPEASKSKVIAFDLDFFVDGPRAIHAKVELLRKIVEKVPLPGEYNENIDVLLRECCTSESNHTTAWVIAENAGDNAALFHLDRKAALLCWEEVYYDVFERKMGYVKVYFNPSVMDLSLLLKF